MSLLLLLVLVVCPPSAPPPRPPPRAYTWRCHGRLRKVAPDVRRTCARLRNRFRQAQELGSKVSRAGGVASMVPSTSELVLCAARSGADWYKWQLEAEGRPLLGKARGRNEVMLRATNGIHAWSDDIVSHVGTRQIDGADQDSLILDTFAHLKWLGDNTPHDWLMMLYDMLPSLKNKATTNDRMRMEVLRKCLKQPGRNKSALN